MFTFLKAQAVSLLASAIDFLITVIAVELIGCWYVLGPIIGTVSGGLTHFSISRSWVFNASEKHMPSQVFRYLMVWIGNLVLNASGVWMVTYFAGINYVVSKALTSILVAFFYNYIIQKRYVFK